jgi:hypothetical protein
MDLIAGLTPAEWNFIREGKIIAAIAEVRTRTGFNLKQSKDLVDSAREVYPSLPPQLLNQPMRPLVNVLLDAKKTLADLDYFNKTHDSEQITKHSAAIRAALNQALVIIRGQE